jgi:ArsR family transcriptional regulator, virulence genes transcriptional regulator
MAKKEMDGAALQRHAEEASQLLKAIGNPVRLMILCTLAQGEHAVGEIHDQIDLSQSALSQHLAVLRREELVKTRREAQTIFYSLRSDEVRAIMQCLQKIYCS